MPKYENLQHAPFYCEFILTRRFLLGMVPKPTRKVAKEGEVLGTQFNYG